MHPHAQQYKPEPDHSEHPSALKAGALTLVAVLAAYAIVYAIPGKDVQVTPVARAQIVTTPLPSVDEIEYRVRHERLQIWRAGYEAAVQNGCQLRLASPLGSRP